MKSRNIKDILEERSIEASENSWEQLAGRLDAYDNKKKRENIYPYAACVAMLIALIGFLIGKTVGETQIVVDTEKTIQVQKDIKRQKPVLNKETIENKVEKAIVAQEETSKIKKVQDEKEKLLKEKLTQNQQKMSAIALQKEIQKPISINSSKATLKRNKEKVAAVLQKDVINNDELKASIAALSAAEKVSISDEKIDQLLKEAQQTLQNLNIKETIDITSFATADELLNEVEYELDMSFKQKVFELVKDKISKTRTAAIDQ